MTEALKNCPFCGKQPVIEKLGYSETYIVCKTPMCANEENYVVEAKAWNARPAPQTPGDEIALMEICQAFGLGCDQWNRDLKNPYANKSSAWAYEYGKQQGQENAAEHIYPHATLAPDERTLMPMDAIENLKAYQRQLDADGIEVGVSREALEQMLAAIGKITPPAKEPS